MHIIQNNPYRIVGLLVGATAALQNRHIKRIPIFIDAGDKIPEEFTTYSFPKLGEINLTVDSVNEASSKLNLDSDKMRAALFWFYNGNEITDEVAFEAMKDGNESRAVEIWRSLAYDDNGEYKIVTQRNASAFHNLATYYLNEYGIDDDALQLELFFLDSEYSKDLITKATDEFNPISQKDLQILFLNTLSSEDTDADTKIMEAIPELEFSAKNDFLKSFVQKPIKEIEKKIEETKTKREANNANGLKFGKLLHEQTSANLQQLKTILGTSNFTFSSISDKVSAEILQCGIDHFSHYKDSNIDPSSAAMDLFHKAKTLAIGSIAKQRCQENTENLREWIDDKPERDKQARILVDFEKLKNLIDEYEGRSETVANGKVLLASARPYLNNVKSILGSTDDLYLDISSRIASDVQGMCVSEINNLQDRFANTYDNATKIASILLLKTKVNEAWDVTTSIGSMDLRQDFRTQYNQNRTSLSNLKTQLAAANTGGGSSGGGNNGSSGCYIATMAYGDYDHPQVMILRQFRDEVLDNSDVGKWFIKTYYHYSPKLVEKLKSKRRINTIIRKTLNQFIKLIK
jgi:hypothetical protein